MSVRYSRTATAAAQADVSWQQLHPLCCVTTTSGIGGTTSGGAAAAVTAAASLSMTSRKGHLGARTAYTTAAVVCPALQAAASVTWAALTAQKVHWLWMTGTLIVTVTVAAGVTYRRLVCLRRVMTTTGRTTSSWTAAAVVVSAVHPTGCAAVAAITDSERRLAGQTALAGRACRATRAVL